MRKLTALILVSFAAISSAAAQSKLRPKVKVVEFADKPALHMVPPEYNNEPAIILQHDVTIDYKFEGRHTVEYYTLHNIVKVLDEKGIANYNTIGFSVGGQTRVPLIKARTIGPDGKVRDIAKDMIKVTQDEYGRHKIVIAMEGVQKNSEIELLLKEIRPFSAFGSEYFQFSVPIVSGHLTVSYPNDFVFEEKGYNGFPNTKDTLLNNRRHLDVTVADVPALHSEPYSFYDVNRMRAEWRVNHFTDANDNDFSEAFTWDRMARGVFDDHYKFTDKEIAAVNGYLTELGVHPKGSEEANIHKIENGIKSGIVLYNYVDGEHTDNLDSIISHKAATKYGYVRLFAACLMQAEVKHEMGLTGDHTEYRFDSKFENWNNLDYYLFYFPNEKKFLQPLASACRYPVVDNILVGGKGVFCNIPLKGDRLVGRPATIRTITPLPASENQSNIAAGITFSDDLDPRIEVSYAYTGYAAAGLREQLTAGTKRDEDELVRRVITFAERPSDIEKYSISNVDASNYNENKPLEITATVHSPFLVSKAGKQYLLRVGEIIGEQGQIYSEKKRTLPVDLPYPHAKNRTITVNIPKGYKLKNPQVLVKESEYVDKNLKSLISFKSDYALTLDSKHGDKLVVTVNENYPQMHFAAADYERFRDVVNTAADFDKVVLLFEKKGGVRKAVKAKPKALASK